MKKKYKPKLFPIPRLGLKRKAKLVVKWVWGGHKYGYCRVSDWANLVGNPKKTDWIFPRGDLVWVNKVRETQGSEKEKYSEVFNFYRKQSGWVQTKDLIDINPLDMLGLELEGTKADTPLEKKLDGKACTNGACAIQNWLRANAMKHVREIAWASDLRKDGDNTQKYIKYYKNKAGDRIIDFNKAPVWPGDLIIFGNPEKAQHKSQYLHTNVLKDPNAKIKTIAWSGHTATIAKLDLEKDTIIKGIDLIEAHLPGGGDTKGTKYTLDDIHYWGIINWGFVATTKRSTDITYWDEVWKDWWYYHRMVYLLLAKKMPEHDEEDWWYYKEFKKTHSADQIEKKAKEEYKLATDLLAKECKNEKRGRPPITIERVFIKDKDKALKQKYSFLDVYGFAYWVEPKPPG